MGMIRLTPERMMQLEGYARQSGKDPAEIADEALAKYLDYEQWFICQVEEGLAAADRGELLEHDEVVRRIDEILR
jgi:predicted transcriptional regulator